VLHCENAEVEEAVHAVAHAGLLGSIESSLLNRAGNTLLPAKLSDVMGFFDVQEKIVR
jgi:hypothetical protein